MVLSAADMQFLTTMYKQYYQTQFKRNFYLPDVNTREFGMILWKSGGFLRHQAFNSVDDLLEVLLTDYLPRHLYASAARFDHPWERSMRQKNYVDGDYLFDLDIDHIFTDCKEIHDRWVCKVCGASGVGLPPSRCPNMECTSLSFKEIAWECDDCMAVAKQQILFLIDEFLIKDFKVDPINDLYIVFSGRRGYHIHITNAKWRTMASPARREIVDYVSGVDIEYFFQHNIQPRAARKPRPTDSGWTGRVACMTLQYLQEASYSDLRKIFRRQRAEEVEAIRQALIKDINSENPQWRHKGLGGKTMRRLVAAAVQKYVPKIDKPVSIDLHRLARLPGSLHGKTGFLVKKLSYEELKAFDPFKDALVFDDSLPPVPLQVLNAPKFRIGDAHYGPYVDQRVRLPFNAAIYLLCRGAATIFRRRREE